jgi:hypothetical protein
MSRLVLCLLALAALPALAACGSSGSSGSASANASASAPPSAGGAGTTSTTPGAPRFNRAALAACLKQQGVTLPPRPPGAAPGGPPPGGGAPPFAAGRRPRGRGFGFFGRNLSPAQRQKLQAALQKCGARFGGGRFGQGRFAANNPRFRAALTKFVACVRQHGFNLPTPNTSGSGPVFDPRKVNRNDPKFVAASRACQGLLRPPSP